MSTRFERDETDDEDDGDTVGSSPPTSDGGEIMIKQEMDTTMNEITEEKEEISLWREPSLIPSYVHDFLPPFPGMEKAILTEGVTTGRRKREREQARDAAAEAWAGANSAITSDPWIDVIPYSSSTIAQINPVPILPSLTPPGSPSELGRRRKRRSVSPPPATKTSSLPSYLNELNYILSLPPTYAPRNAKRRQAATTLSFNALAPAGDSLFGLIPIDSTRSAALNAGFYPDDVNFTAIHPFNTALPWTISRPIPARPSPHSTLLAPPVHSRLPTILPALVKSLSGPTSTDLQMFSRLTRMGPPSAMTNAGKALNYGFVGETGLIDSGTEWKRRFHNARLPKKEGIDGATLGAGEGGTGEVEEEKTGIKLSLKRTAVFTPTPTPAPEAQEDSVGGSNMMRDMTVGMESIGEEPAVDPNAMISMNDDIFTNPLWNATASSSTSASSYLPVLYPPTNPPVASSSTSTSTSNVDCNYDPLSNIPGLTAFLNLPLSTNTSPVVPIESDQQLPPAPTAPTIFDDATFASFMLPPPLPSSDPAAPGETFPFDFMGSQRLEEEDVKPFVMMREAEAEIEELLRLGMGEGEQAIPVPLETPEDHGVGHQWLNSDP